MSRHRHLSHRLVNVLCLPAVVSAVPQAVTGAVTHHLAFQAQGLLQSLGLANGSSDASSSAEEKPTTPLENLSRNAQAELLNRLQEALAVYHKWVGVLAGNGSASWREGNLGLGGNGSIELVLQQCPGP